MRKVAKNRAQHLAQLRSLLRRAERLDRDLQKWLRADEDDAYNLRGPSAAWALLSVRNLTRNLVIAAQLVEEKPT